MTLLHPEFLWFAPLLAAPVLIHLLNRLRYRRVRWAAIDFLLASERRAVRRARLRHLLLMAMRILVLAMALGALVQPVLRGRLSGLLGGSDRIVVLLDSSSSMAATDVSGQAFARARSLAEQNLRALPRAARVSAATFTDRYHGPFDQPLLDHRAVADLLASAELTAGPGNVPEALRAAAESLARGGGGGTIWLLSDLQAVGWRPGDEGAWQQARQALSDAGTVRIIVTDMAPAVQQNLSVAGVRLDEPVLLAGDEPRLIVTVQLHTQPGGGGSGSPAAAGARTTVSLFLDTADDGPNRWEQTDARSVELSAPGRMDVPFRLPAMPDRPVAGYVELAPDAMPGDDRHYFLLHPSRRARVLVLDGRGGTDRGRDSPAGGFLAWALAPGESALAIRSPFEPHRLGVERLAEAGELSDYAAVLLTDAPRWSGEWADRLDDYVRSGGLLLLFAGAAAQPEGWNGGSLLDGAGVRLGGLEEFTPADRARLVWASPNHPATAKLATANLDRVVIDRMHRIEADGTSQVLATAGPASPDGGGSTAIPTGAGTSGRTRADLPFLVAFARGRGRVYLYAVSAERDFSSLPDSPVLLVTLHQAIRTHLSELSAPLSQEACRRITVPLAPGAHAMLVPGPSPDKPGQVLPVVPLAESAAQAAFEQTERAGIYRLIEGDQPDPEKASDAMPVAAVSPPAEESDLERIAPESIRRLVGETSVYFTSAQADAGEVRGGDGERGAAAAFPLAAAALLFLLCEVLLGWSLGRPARAEDAPPGGSATGSREMQNEK